MTTPASDTRRDCRTREDRDAIKLDKEFENLIPPLSPSELADLHRSLEKEGCRDALILWQGHDILVDGHNRLRYCKDKDIAFSVVERAFEDKDAVKAYIIHEQLGRRNLSRSAESYLRGKRYLEAKHQGKSSGASGQSDPKRVSEQLAEEFKVGEKTIRRDASFASAVDKIVDNCGHPYRNLILSRDSGLTRGGVMRLGKLSPEEQKEFLKQLKESGKRPRKMRKARRRQMITIPAQPKAMVKALLEQLKPEEVEEVSKALAEAMTKAGVDGEKAGGRKVR